MIPVNVSLLKNTRNHGAVYLLGCGPSLGEFEPKPGIDLIGLNRSWLRFPDVADRVIVDAANYIDVRDGRQGCQPPRQLWMPLPRVAQQAPDLGPRASNMELVTITHLVLPRRRPVFQLNLEEGSWAPFCGLFALEIAVWLGYTDIRLAGFDGVAKSHFFDDSGFGQKPRTVTEALFRSWETWFLDAARVLEAERPRVKVRFVTPTAHRAFPKAS